MNNGRCVVLVPVGHRIDPGTEESLRVLELRGYRVRRVFGQSAIDVARCQMASDALRDNADEIVWIDSDVLFRPDDVERLRQHNLPLVCGLYPKKSAKEFACRFLPGTSQVKFGAEGGLLEVRYAGFGFVHTRRAVYDLVRDRLQLPLANRDYGAGMWPFFLPQMVPHEKGLWYLAEDYSFCERCRQCGVKILADTTIRLHHVGQYGFGWDDVLRTLGQPPARMGEATPSTAEPVLEPPPLGPERP